MKRSPCLPQFVCAVLWAIGLSTNANDLTATNLTITESMAIGQVNINEPGGTTITTVPGFRVNVSQQAATETFTNVIYYEGYSTQEPVTTYEYGWVETGGYYQDSYGWGVINSYWVDDVWGDNGSYDENGNWISSPYLITSGYWQEEYGEVYLGQQWISGTSEWQVTGSSTNYETVYHEPRTETEEVQYLAYDRPKIKFAATRTDANWAWQVPTSNQEQQSMRDVLVVFDGGLKVPSRLPDENMSLLADNLTYSRAISGTESNATQASQVKAENVKLSSVEVFTDASRMNDEARLEARNLTFSYSYTSPENATTTRQTQISAEASHFGGMVTMEDQLRVKSNVDIEGVVRIMPAGNLSMGAFTQGQAPVQQTP